jgi:hypothetical protein
MAKKKTSSKKKAPPKPKAVPQIPLVQRTVSERPTVRFLTTRVPAHVHGNFLPPTPSERKALDAQRLKHHQTFYQKLELKFIELEKSDQEADHQLDAESRKLLAAARLRWGPRADKAHKRKQLFNKFSELWKRAHKLDCRKPENEDGERPPKEVLNFETKKEDQC